MEAKRVLDAAARARAVMARCDHLAHFSEDDGRLTRRYGTPSLRAAQDTVAGWMTAAGMTVRRDAIGNLIGRYEDGQTDRRTDGPSGGRGPKTDSDDGRRTALCYPSVRPSVCPSLLLGGHLDTVRDAGKYDGTLGVLVGIACVERLWASAAPLSFAVEVVAFADEEGVRFHTAYLGSWAFAGTLDPALLTRTDEDGVTLATAIRSFGGDPAAVASGGHVGDRSLGFVEVHIEQGPVLEAAGLPVGVVAAIAGQTRLALTVAGEAGHAGTVPMAGRRDALCAAAEFVLAVERIGRTTDGLVATVGQLTAEPGASNVIPGNVRLTLDVRHTDDAVRREAVDAILEQAHAIARTRGVSLAFANRNDAHAVTCDLALTARLAEAVSAAGYPVRQLVSGAGHDAVALSARMPVAMLFVRCAGGVSHNPAESVSVEDVAAAIEVMDRLVSGLAEGG